MLGESAICDRSVGTDFVTLMLKTYALEVGISTERLSSHSMRRGHAHQADKGGASIAQIQSQGGWKSLQTVAVYLDEAASRERNSSKSLGL